MDEKLEISLFVIYEGREYVKANDFLEWKKGYALLHDDVLDMMMSWERTIEESNPFLRGTKICEETWSSISGRVEYRADNGDLYWIRYVVKDFIEI